jgi:hypothetical protein
MTNPTTPPEPESAQAKKTRLEIARRKAAEANALLQKLEALAKTRESKNGRKLDTRRKVLLGAYLLAKIKKDDDEKGRVLEGLDKYLTRPAERSLFDLPALAGSPAPTEAQSSGSAAVQEQAPGVSADSGENAPPAQSWV